VDRLSEFVAIPSVSGDEGRLADRIVGICGDAGVSAARRGRNVVAQRGDGGPRLLLNSHLDTVPPVEGWSADPWSPRLSDGRLVGLGANDAKASVAAMLEAFLTAPLHGSGSLVFAATCDEETGGEGMETLAAGLAFDDAIVGEPNGFTVAVSQKGLVKLRLTARGRAGHAARPHLADNAIVRAAKDVLAVEGLEFPVEDPHLGKPTAAVTLVSGGVKSNVVPDRCDDGGRADDRGFDNEAMIAAIRNAVSSGRGSARVGALPPVRGDPASRIARAALPLGRRRRDRGLRQRQRSRAPLRKAGNRLRAGRAFGVAPRRRVDRARGARPGSGRLPANDRSLLLMKRGKKALWGGGYAGGSGEALSRLSVSYAFDRRLAAHDLAGTRAHARGLRRAGLLTAGSAHEALLKTIERGDRRRPVPLRGRRRDIHLNVERRLIELAGRRAGASTRAPAQPPGGPTCAFDPTHRPRADGLRASTRPPDRAAAP
jgi:hypothetical protein